MDGYEVLDQTLSKLKEWNLEGQVACDRERVAQGGFGSVYYGKLQPGGRRIAIKQAHVYVSRTSQFKKCLAKEITISSKLKHANIATFVGFIVEDGLPLLVTEWADNGTVMEYLETNPACHLGNIAFGIAKGLKYLHDNDVIHCDLKSDNVLMNSTGDPLITDFGLSRITFYSQQLLVSSSRDGSKGSILWMAPELLSIEIRNDVKPTKASDMWAYGMIIYELLTRKRPYYHLELRTEIQAVLAIAYHKHLPELPIICESEDESSRGVEAHLCSLSQLCWAWDPAERMTAEGIADDLAEYDVVPSSARISHSPLPPTSPLHDNGSDDVTSVLAEETLLQETLFKFRHLDFTKEIDRERRLTRTDGEFHDVFVSTFRPTGVMLAIKSPRWRNSKYSAKQLTIWSKLNHPNVLTLFGYIIEDGFPFLLYEWQENGTIGEYLFENPDGEIGKLALGIASGLKYLHDNDVVHGDLTSFKILISRAGTPLICGSVLSEMVSYSDARLASSRDGMAWGALRWMAFELHGFESKCDVKKHTKASDMWAFGMTIYELIAGKIPYWHLDSLPEVLVALCEKRLPLQPASISEPHGVLWKLCQRCWSFDPENRPTVEQALCYLDIAFD